MNGNPARHLQEVYAVVLGVALVLAVEQVIDTGGDGSPFRGQLVLPFLAFVSLAFSVYHWGVTYLDRRYADGRATTGSRWGVFVDLLVGTFELLTLIGLSILISRPLTFAVGVVIVLTFEVVAGVVLGAVRNYQSLGAFPRTYLWLNLATVALLVLALLILEVTSEGAGELAAGLVVFIAAVARTAVFYGLGFGVLFAEDESG
jgi:hypothetical protein